MEILRNLSVSFTDATLGELLFGTIVLICVVQAVILTFIWCDRYKIKRRYIDLKQKIQFQQLSSQYSSLQKSTAMTVDKVMQPTSEADKEKDNALATAIFNSLQRLMKEEKIYHNPRLTRDEVVAKLGTSRKTFLEALQYHINMSFIEYTNKFRLDEAISLLENGEYTNETIAEEVGFGSVNTFYRQFRQKYGISPSEYRKALNDNLVLSGY